MSDVIAAISTGNVVSAIGILRLTGPGCARVAGKVFLPQNGRPLWEAIIMSAKSKLKNPILKIFQRAFRSLFDLAGQTSLF